MNILVVEDEERVRQMAISALRAAGYEVIEAATGEEALSRCKEHTVDLLFTDIRLPGTLDGWDVAEHCRASHPSIPVVYASGYSHKEARHVPGSVYIPKPYRPSLLVKTIRDLIGSTSGL